MGCSNFEHAQLGNWRSRIAENNAKTCLSLLKISGSMKLFLESVRVCILIRLLTSKSPSPAHVELR